MGCCPSGIIVLVMVVMGVAGAINVHWCPKQCDCFNQYTTVDCSKRGLQTLPSFSNLTMRLYLEDNRLEELPLDGFANTPNLLVVTLYHNRIKHFSTAALCGLSRLEKINLSGNNIHTFEVSNGSNCVAPHLHELNIYNNRLLNPPTNLSHFAPNMLKLNLSFNTIGSAFLDPSYRHMHVLHTLDLHGNPIHEIEADDFEAASESLEVLNLSDCGLASGISPIDPAAFRHMQNLTSLFLPDNLLQSSVLQQAFEQLGNASRLQYLDLSDMYITNLTASMLGMFSQMNYLKVDDSGIEWVDGRLWSMLKNLETLHMENNRIKTLDNLSALTELRNLYVHNNKLEHVEVRPLYNLELLDLSHNNIKSLPSNWMVGTDILFKLNLSSNGLSSIDTHAFDAVNLHTLDLCYNNLHVLSTFGRLKLSNLYLCHNQISSVTLDAFDQLDTTLEELDLSYNNLTHFQHHAFHDFISLQRLNLAHNHLGPAFSTMDKLGGLFASLGHLQVLNLAYNSIRTMPHQHLRHLRHLTTLYLQGNLIHDLLDLSLVDVKSLAKLVVSNNQLRAVEPAVLVSLEYLEEVDLSNNPYDCSCHLLHYLHWLNNTLVTVLYTDVPLRYQCMYPSRMRGKYILNYRPPAEECLHYEHMHILQHNLTVVGISVAALFIFGIIVTLFLYYGQICQRIKSLQYRWQVRYREVSGVEIAGDPKV